jgi:dienelactone hydrolase
MQAAGDVCPIHHLRKSVALGIKEACGFVKYAQTIPKLQPDCPWQEPPMRRSIRLSYFLTRLLLFAAVLPTCVQAVGPTSQPSELKTLLDRPVLLEGQPLAELKAFCDRRIAVMSHPISWSAWQHEAERIRTSVLENVVFRGVPPTWRDSSRRIEWLNTIAGGPGYSIRKLRYEAIPGLWIPALLYEPEQLKGRVPVVLNVNGHDSKGMAAPYKQIRCINLAKRGMLALNVEWFGMGELKGDGFSHTRMNQLDLCGISGLAVFYLAMERALDVLIDLPHADVERVGMAGLSGGGWQTILLSSLDPRVTLANPVAGYSSFKTRLEFIAEVGDSEQAPADLAMIADYTHLTAIRAPRPTLLTYNVKDDCCFASEHALQPLLDAALPIYELAGAETRLRSHVNKDPGTNNFERENREALYKMIGDHFYRGETSFVAAEIESQKEVKTAEELSVPLPENNLDFHKLALARMTARESRNTHDTPNAERHGTQPEPTHESVARIARLADYQPFAEKVDESVAGDTKATYWRIRLGNDWTVPVVELRRGEPRSTSCIAADGGRTTVVDQIESLLSKKSRVLAVDPFYLGESNLGKHGDRLALVVSSVGARPLGVQADQLRSVTRWATTRFGKPVEQVVANGPRISLAALVAAATAAQDERPQRVVLHGSLASLRQIVDNDWSVDKYPELFCFGLYQLCDVDDLIALAKPCEVVRN